MSVEHQTITVLISARKNSKYLAKFLFGLVERTHSLPRLDVRVILNEHDTWNSDLQAFYERYTIGDWRPFKFYRENLRLGRAGLHEYFNMMLDEPVGEWVVYFCEDHFINARFWDQHLRKYISGEERSGDSEGKQFPLNPDDVWVLVPKFDNAGSMNHIVSRGFIKALGGKIGNHGWIDSYINDLFYTDGPLRNRVIRIDEEWFHDFTHDQPSPMSDAHLQTVISARGKNLPKYDTAVVRHRIALDREALLKAIEREERS